MLPILISLFAALPIVPDAPNAKYAQPQIAAKGQTVALTFGAGKVVYFAASTDEGRSFSKPVKVSEATFLALGRHRGPRIALAGGDIVITAVVGEQRGHDGDVVAWRSHDGGKTWSQGVKVNDVVAAAREGLHSLAAGRDGTLFATWLDLRAKGTRLYGAVSKDRGATWSPNFLVYESPDGHICECCHPSALAGPNGELYAMWRNWLGGKRDLWLATSSDGGRSFRAEKLGKGSWPLNACPMDGGSFAVDSKGRLQTAWRRESTVFVAAAGAPEVELGKGKDPAIAAGRAGIYLAWTGEGGIRVQSPGREAELLAPGGSFVSLAGSGPVYAAWEEGGTVKVEKLGE